MSNRPAERLDRREFMIASIATAGASAALAVAAEMRRFVPVELAPYSGVLAYLQRIGGRKAYRRAMEKGDPGFPPMLA